MQKKKRPNRAFTIILASLLTGAYAVGLVSAVGANAEDFYPEESAVPVSWAEEPSDVWSEPPQQSSYYYETSDIPSYEWSEPPYESSTVWSEPPQESSYYYETSNIPAAEYIDVQIDDFYCRKYSDHIAVLYYTGDDDNVVIPEILDNLPVKKINESVLETHCLTLTIPKTVEFIGFVANYIAYASISKIRAYIVDEDNLYYSSDDGVLFDKSKEVCIQCPPGKQGNYVVPEGTVKIQKEAFENSHLRSIKLPSSLKMIEEFAFNNCYYLESLSIEDGVKEIGFGVFYGCSALSGLVIPDSVESIDNDAFDYTKSMAVIGSKDGFAGSFVKKQTSDKLIFIDLNDVKKDLGDYEISERNDGKKIFAFIAQEEDDYVFINASKSESFTVSQYGLYEYLSHSGYEHTIHLYKNQPIVFEFKDVDFPVNVTVSKWKISDHSVGITGSFNYWDDNDIEMTDENEDGIYEGVIDIPNVQSWQTLPDHNGSATIQFKVRLDKSWNDEWAEYEYYRDRTYNSQVNCAVPAEIGSHLKIYVYFDTTKMSADALEHEDSGSRLALKNGTVDSQWYEIRYTYEVVSDRVQGDTNGDGKATIADSLMIARYEVKLRTLTNEQLAVSDVNYDGKVTIADALKIARYEVKLIDSL